MQMQQLWDALGCCLQAIGHYSAQKKNYKQPLSPLEAAIHCARAYAMAAMAMGRRYATGRDKMSSSGDPLSVAVVLGVFAGVERLRFKEDT